MRKVTFSVATSLDNFLARKDESVDWLLFGDEAAAVMSSFGKSIDTMLWGRRTYEFAVRNGQKDGYPGLKNFVFSRTLAASGQVTIVAEDAAAFVRRLKQQDGKDIALMGGGELARSLFEAGLIDELALNVHPILLGEGIALFHPMSRQIQLKLRESRPFKNGCVYLVYEVIHARN
jgi:dihydrofolate reductase